MDEDESDHIFRPLPTVALLLRHLTFGCSSHPTSLYPTILLILATLPASHLPPTAPALALLFESFWVGYSSRAIAIGGARAVQAWAAALLEAVLYETSRVDDADLAAGIAREWLGERLFALVLGRGEDGKCPSGARSLAAGFEKPLARLERRENSTAYEACWDAIVGEATAAVTAAASLTPESQAALPPLAAALQSFAASTNETLREKGRQLALECLRLATTGVAQAGQGWRCDELLAFILELAGSVDDAESQSVGLLLFGLPSTVDADALSAARSWTTSHGITCPPSSPTRPPPCSSLSSASRSPPPRATRCGATSSSPSRLRGSSFN